jgi:chorismate synthase
VKPRPGHADLTGLARYNGANDPRGGGHFSARIMAPLTFAGAVAMQILESRGVQIRGHIYEIAGIRDIPYDMMTIPDSVAGKRLPVLSDEQGVAMAKAIEAARMDTDSVGGIVECLAAGFPAGLGRPISTTSRASCSILSGFRRLRRRVRTRL